jgi:hypothetical protein
LRNLNQQNDDGKGMIQGEILSREWEYRVMRDIKERRQNWNIGELI